MSNSQAYCEIPVEEDSHTEIEDFDLDFKEKFQQNFQEMANLTFWDAIGNKTSFLMDVMLRIMLLAIFLILRKQGSFRMNIHQEDYHKYFYPYAEHEGVGHNLLYFITWCLPLIVISLNYFYNIFMRGYHFCHCHFSSSGSRRLERQRSGLSSILKKPPNLLRPSQFQVKNSSGKVMFKKQAMDERRGSNDSQEGLLGSSTCNRSRRDSQSPSDLAFRSSTSSPGSQKNMCQINFGSENHRKIYYFSDFIDGCLCHSLTVLLTSILIHLRVILTSL